MAVRKELFGTTKEGREISKFWIENEDGIKACVTDMGANLLNLLVPDKDGKEADVVLGYATLEDYVTNESFLGATVGPNANRIANASFEIDDVKYELVANDGANNLHSDKQIGYHVRVWDVAEVGENFVTFSLEDADGCMGFPGNKKILVTYKVTADNALEIHYQGTSDKKTILNMTNHTYFNLAGHDSGDIHDHVLEMKASHYTPIVKGAIPTGEIAPVAGTPFDFTSAKRIGDDIDADEEQLKLVGGYDHNWVIDDADGSLQEFATVTEPVSGRVMKVYTDLPGVQFYASNSMNIEGAKGGAHYKNRAALCLETQYYPDTANKPQFPSAVFGPDRAYDTVTVYKFV
ncbi:MAG: galactose mutarotase [Lachnospiraceae bacterium]|nr:galactose mutarotase [Lachnospiraceae bacterium]